MVYMHAVCMFCTGCYLALPSFKSYLHASIADLQSLHNICILFSSVCVFDHDYVSLYGDSMKILLSIQIHIYIQFGETNAGNNQRLVFLTAQSDR